MRPAGPKKAEPSGWLLLSRPPGAARFCAVAPAAVATAARQGTAAACAEGRSARLFPGSLQHSQAETTQLPGAAANSPVPVPVPVPVPGGSGQRLAEQVRPCLEGLGLGHRDPVALAAKDQKRRLAEVVPVESTDRAAALAAAGRSKGANLAEAPAESPA